MAGYEAENKIDEFLQKIQPNLDRSFPESPIVVQTGKIASSNFSIDSIPKQNESNARISSGFATESHPLKKW